MTSQLSEDDFMEALKAIGGCAHVPPPHTLSSICGGCREAITKMVLLREHWEADPRFFEGRKPG